MHITSESRINHTNQEVTRANGALTVSTGARRHTDAIGGIPIFSVMKSLLDRYPEVFHFFLYFNDPDTLLNLRRVSKAIYELSMKSMSGLSPLMSKAVISCVIEQLIGPRSEKLEFALEYTSVRLFTINISHLNNPALLGNIVGKTNINLVLNINNANELSQFDALHLSDQLLNEQKWVLSRIEQVSFMFDITAPLTPLSLSKLPNLKSLDFWDINAPLTLLEIPSLTSLRFGHIIAPLTLLGFSNLTSLEFKDIRAALTLPKLSNLTWLEFGHITVALTLSELPNLTSLKFKSITAVLTLLGLPSLTSLEFGKIEVAFMLPELPSLKSLLFGKIEVALTLPDLPSLTSLSLWYINAVLTLIGLPSLTSLKIGYVGVALTLPELSGLTSLSCGGVDDQNVNEINALLNFFAIQERASQLTSLAFDYISVALTLPEFPNLTSLEIGDIEALLTLLKLPRLTSLAHSGSINDKNVNAINALLSFFATQERASQLTSLSFGDINTRLTLPEFPMLTLLEFGNIDALLTLLKLPRLTSLSFRIIKVALTLPELPSLTSLNYKSVYIKKTRKYLEAFLSNTTDKHYEALPFCEMEYYTVIALFIGVVSVFGMEFYSHSK